MKIRRIDGHKILCDRRSCYPQREGCHTEIYFTEDEIIWEYDNLPDRTIKLKDVFPYLSELNVRDINTEYITGTEFGHIICPVCGEKLFYGTRELKLPLIDKVLAAGNSPENLSSLEEAVSYYRGNMYSPLKDLIDKDDIQRGQKEASAFVSYTHGPLEEV